MIAAPIFALLSLLLQTADQDPYARIVDLLRSRTIDAFLHRSLLEKRGLKDDQVGGFIGPPGIEYTVRSFPVELDRHEEWPTVLGGTRFLLEPVRHAQLREVLKVLGTTPERGTGLLERVHVQSELWAAFDGLLQDGVLPLDAAERARWSELLELIAQAMRRITPTDNEIRRLPDGTALREHLFEKLGGENARPIAYYTLQTPSLHDVSHRYRRVSRFYYWDPSLDFQNLDPGFLAGLKDRSSDLSSGAVAVIEEDALVVTQTGYPVVTNLPLLFKVYRVRRGPEGELALDFELYHIDPKASPGDPSALLAAGPRAEVWSKANLPNIPGNGNKGPFRAPLAHVCGGCHNANPIAFRPTSSTLDPRYYVFGQDPYPRFPGARVMQVKASSVEFEVLREHFRLEGRFTNFAPAPAPAPAPAASPSSIPASVVGVGVCLLTFIALAFLKKKPRGKEAGDA